MRGNRATQNFGAAMGLEAGPATYGSAACVALETPPATSPCSNEWQERDAGRYPETSPAKRPTSSIVRAAPVATPLISSRAEVNAASLLPGALMPTLCQSTSRCRDAAHDVFTWDVLARPIEEPWLRIAMPSRAPRPAAP